MDELLVLGEMNARADVRYAPLDWHAVPVEVDAAGTVTDSTLRAIAAISGNGLYVIEGCHDAHPMSCVLYVGSSGTHGAGDQLGSRITQSLGLGSKTEKLANRGRVWSTFWNITLRWCSVMQTESIMEIESLLIQAHLPPLNSAEIRGFYKGSVGLVILNAGAKGRLLPCVVSDYYRQAPWPAGAA